MSVRGIDRAALLGDVVRAASWLASQLAAARRDGASCEVHCATVLGLDVAALTLRDPAIAGTAQEAADTFAGALRAGGGQPRDAVAFALVAALHPGESAFAPARGALTAAAHGVRPLEAGPDACAQVLGGDDAALAALCDRIELRGVRGNLAARRELGLALAARAFSAARAPTRSAFAMHVLRAAAGARLDPATTAEALAFARRQQRVDGAYGHLPVSTQTAGDLRAAFHLPWTVAALRLVHDALAPVPLVRAKTSRQPEGDSPSARK